MKDWIAKLISVSLWVFVAAPALGDTTADRIEGSRQDYKARYEEEREARRSKDLEALRREYEGSSRDDLLEEILDLRDERDELSSDVDSLREELDPPREEPWWSP